MHTCEWIKEYSNKLDFLKSVSQLLKDFKWVTWFHELYLKLDKDSTNLWNI